MKIKSIALLCGAVSLLASSLPVNAQRYSQDRYGYHWQDRYYVYYQPRVYAYRAVQQQRYSAVDCDSYAANYAHHASMEGDILAGGAFGSLAGLGIGALFAASGVGAAIGATVGIIGGGAVRNQREQQLYAAAYQDCVAGIAR
jgi:hypothetical protein